MKVGDIVRLRSGGPKMTVTAVVDDYGTPTVRCAWFDGSRQSQASFPAAAVALAD